MVLSKQISVEEAETAKIIISIICAYGSNGLPLYMIEKEFLHYCGFPIPWKKFGAVNLKSWLKSMPYIYITKDDFNNEILIEESPKSMHVKELVLHQKQASQCQSIKTTMKRKQSFAIPSIDNQNDKPPYKMKKRLECDNLPEGCFIYNSLNTNYIEINKYKKFTELESMLPLFYKHQALGDDFFLDIADSKLGYYIPDNGPKECGLCAAGQTISALTKKVQNANNIAPRVVIMIGFQDLLNGESIISMITHLRELIMELRKRRILVTLITLIPSPKLCNKQYEFKMDIYNRAIIDYGSDPILKCSIIDMNHIFSQETEKFKKDFDRFKKVTKNDPYKVFSDYGRKIFLNTLKSCLKKQIENNEIKDVSNL